MMSRPAARIIGCFIACFNVLSCFNAWSSKHLADLELEALDTVAGLLVERVTVAYFQRPYRRIPRDPRTCRVAERFELRLLSLVVDLARVEEYRQPHRLVRGLGTR